MFIADPAAGIFGSRVFYVRNKPVSGWIQGKVNSTQKPD